MNHSRQLRSSTEPFGWLALLGLVGASSCARLLDLEDLEFTEPIATQGGTGGEGQSSGIAGEQIGGPAGSNAGQGACGGACTDACLEGVCCPTGHSNCDGECFDLLTSAGRCGSCGTTCAVGQVCLEGVCCPAGHANCGGECFDLRTSARHCGSCETTCAADKVCYEGQCSSDCGTLARCDNDCVDLARNPYHCQRCGTECPPPPPNGTAVCAGRDGCDIECDQKRCGNSCCPPPPTNGYVACGSDNECEVRCNADHHACGTDTAACYHDNDVEHCGTSCYDCRQPNATVRCIDSRCANICDGPVTFPCDDPSGKLGCGIWDFESHTNEGWLVDLNGMTNAWTGMLGATQAQAYWLTNSLAFGFDGDGDTNPGGRHTIELTVSLCPNGSSVNWPSRRRFGFHYFLEPASGIDPPRQAEVFVRLRDGIQEVFKGCDTVLDTVADWKYVRCDFPDPDFPDPLVISHLSLVFRIFNAPWKGTIYIDRASLFDPP